MASHQRIIRAGAIEQVIAAAAAADQSGNVCRRHKAPSESPEPAVNESCSSGSIDAVSSRTAGYGVAASTEFNDIVAAILQRNGVGTVAGRDQHVAVARHGKILRTAGILEDDGLQVVANTDRC